jgi:hypothetical protein
MVGGCWGNLLTIKFMDYGVSWFYHDQLWSVVIALFASVYWFIVREKLCTIADKFKWTGHENLDRNGLWWPTWLESIFISWNLKLWIWTEMGDQETRAWEVWSPGLLAPTFTRCQPCCLYNKQCVQWSNWISHSAACKSFGSIHFFLFHFFCVGTCSPIF